MSHLISWPVPVLRQTPWFPGQMGVPGSDVRQGLRTSVEGTIFYVDPNYPGATATADGTDPLNPLSTVAAALARCQPFHGDVIAVMANNAWGYGNAADGVLLPIAEEVTITIPGVRLVGVHPAGANGVLWTPASNGGTCITVNALDTLIEGFVFDEGAFAGCNAISADWDGVATFADNLVVRNCVFTDTVDTAIQLEYTWYVHIYNNVFWACDAYGIYVDPAGSGAAYATILDNVFHDCAVAMAVNNLDNSLIHRNSFYSGNAQGGGVATDEGIDTTGGQQNQVFNNFFSCLLPVPANGDWNDFNTAAATDAWVGNQCMNGPNTTNPT